ncbi:MAG: bacteriorhodopsin [Polaromonas sp.]|nr:bacteriorhodopsin [Gemmatimonadaceae bacterium]
MDQLTYGQYSLVYNAFSFVIAAMGAATIFLFLSRSQIAPNYKTAVTISGLVTMIACYHYFRIFASWETSYSVSNGIVTASGSRFNDAYRYVDWLLTVPLLVTELILVMNLPGNVGAKKASKLAALAAAMILLGYPGEISNVASTRFLWWGLSMIPFLIIQYELFVGLKSAIALQPENARGLVSAARYITVVTWLFYPIVYLFPLLGLSGAATNVGIQVGYSVADVLAKAGFGIVVYMIALRKTQYEPISARTSPTLAVG